MYGVAAWTHTIARHAIPDNRSIGMTRFYETHSKVYVSVDCIVFGFDEEELKVLIGKRQMDPGRGQWSVYGGFVGSNESIDAAATRVLSELTGLTSLYMRQVGAFGNVDRDPGERVISIVYYSMINVKDYDKSLMEQHGLKWVSFDDIPPLYSDHLQMIHKARTMMREKISCEPISFNLLPELFTLTQLQHVYEAISGEEVDKRNFRKRVKEMKFIEKTDQIDKKSSKRGAFMYRFNKNTYKNDSNFKL